MADLAGVFAFVEQQRRSIAMLAPGATLTREEVLVLLGTIEEAISATRHT